MKHGKKFLALCLSLLLVMSLLTACGNKATQESDAEPGVEDTVDTQEPSIEEVPGTDADADANKPDAEAPEGEVEAPKEPTPAPDTNPSAGSSTTTKPSGGSGNTTKPSGGSGNTTKPSGGSGNNSKPSGGSGNNSKPSGGSGNNSNPSGGSGGTTTPEKPATVTGPAGTPIELIDKLYAQKAVELMLGTVPVDLSNADSVNAYLGLSDASKVKEAAVSEALIGSQAYSLAVVRVKDSKDAASVAKSMKSGINPRKWVCVEADDLRVAYCGDVVMLIMVQSSMADMVTSAQMVTAFQSVCGTQSVTTV